MNDIRENKPWTTDQVKNEKPNVAKSEAMLSGFVANSMNAAHNKVVGYKRVMAGEFHKEMRLNASFKMITPKTPNYQNVYITARCYYVPDIRVWKNAEKYTAQKGGATEIKIKSRPHLGGKVIPLIKSVVGNEETMLSNTEMWRDSYISSYIPRMGLFTSIPTDEGASTRFYNILPAVDVLPLRGRKAIYNDFERNREYDEELFEYDGDTVSQAEWESYLPNNLNIGYEKFTMRAKKPNSYYSDYRTELQGFEQEPPEYEGTQDTFWADWASLESKIAEMRSQAENAQARDVEIIAKLRGSKVLTEGKVQLIGKKTFKVNYSSVTQNTYNNNEDVNEEFRVMGQQGAFSYTNVDIPLYAGMVFNEEGYIHVILTMSADTVYESAFDRVQLNITPLDEYRPDLVDDKKDVLYQIEMGTAYAGQSSSETVTPKIVGFKRKFSEYFKLNNNVAGDMTSKNYFKNTPPSTVGVSNKILLRESYDKDNITITQKTFQCFEESNEYFYDSDTTQYLAKYPWKDYSDLVLNKNMAVKQTILSKPGTSNQDEFLEIAGPNQIFFVGMMLCNAVLPIDEKIKTNYTQWGEH